MTATPSPVLLLLVELARRGIELRAAGDRLRYRPRSAMTPDLADRQGAHRGELLAIRAAADVAPLKSATRDGAARLIRDARREAATGTCDADPQQYTQQRQCESARVGAIGRDEAR